jgi:nitrosocyanin
VLFNNGKAHNSKGDSMKICLSIAALVLSVSTFAAKRSITLVNYETDGVKQWLPGTIIVKKGDDVEITLINNVPSGVHGFFIPDFNVRKDVKKGVKEVVKFKADKEGLFDMKCHLHPAHVGGQLLVQP